MDGAFSRSGLPKATLAHELPLRTAALYEDTACAEKAGQIYRELLPRFGDDCDFQCAWWTYDHLDSPETFESAKAEARRADMIVLAAHADHYPPPVVRAWLELAFAETSQRDRALIALLGGVFEREKLEHRPLDDYLNETARRHGIHYLPYWFELGKSPDSGAHPNLERRKAMTTPFPPPRYPLPTDYSDWGLNE